MKSRILILLILISAVLSARDETGYAVNKITEGLKQDANAVIRLNYSRFEVKGSSDAVLKTKIAVTIFSKEERDYGVMVLEYDNMRSIEEFEGKIYDAGGKEVRELDEDKIADHLATSDYSLYEDNRVKVAELYYDVYPYTVEFTTEISFDGFISWPSWYSRDNIDPIEKSIFEVVMPKGQELRYWVNHETAVPVITKEGSITTYKWEAVNQPKLPEDAVDNDLIDVADAVLIAPASFEIEGYKGDMTSWKTFGSWYYQLTKDRKILPEGAKSDVQNLLADVTDNHDKIRKLYKYMQNRTRYVSVQFGIGGYQPFDAKYVHEHSYGDCKALSNYMISLLNEAGITSYPVLIKSGNYRLPMRAEFPSNQFNHVIVCVPSEKDTMWLECTSQTIFPGRIGWKNENRDALLVTPEGGVVIRTPQSLSEKNSQVKRINVSLLVAKADIDLHITYKGNQHDYARSLSMNNTSEEKEKWLFKLFEAPNISIGNYSFDSPQDTSTSLGLDCRVSLPQYATVSGSRLFFIPNLMERVTDIPKEVKERLSPVTLSYPYLDIDSIYYSIPEGYTIEALPDPVKVSYPFGEFSSQTLKLDETNILYVRSMEVKEYSIPADKYADYRRYYTDISKADRSKVVLVKKK